MIDKLTPVERYTANMDLLMDLVGGNAESLESVSTTRQIMRETALMCKGYLTITQAHTPEEIAELQAAYLTVCRQIAEWR